MCRLPKSLDSFHKNKKMKDGLQHRCIECRKNYNTLRFDKVKKYKQEYDVKNKEKNKMYYIRKFEVIKAQKQMYNKVNSVKIAKQSKRYSYLYRYGITKEIYDEMYEKQNGVCAICNQPEKLFDKRANRVKVLAVDHNHKTGNVRGLLCQSCNTGIGLFEDNIKIMKMAIEYLKEEHKNELE